MKKFVSLLLALMMALSLVACGSKADTTTDVTISGCRNCEGLYE